MSIKIIPVIKFLNNKRINEIIGRSKIFIRDSKIQAMTVVKVFCFGLWDIPDTSLRQIAGKMEDEQRGLKITKQGVFKKLSQCVELLKETFKLAIEYSLAVCRTLENSYITGITAFSDILICDSTFITLPDKLEKIWKGPGGKRGVKASLKIQTIYSVLTRTIKKFELFKGAGSDAEYNDLIVNYIRRSMLVITDLGYFARDFFREVENKKAYYLSRLRSKTVIHIENSEGKLIQIPNLLRILKENIVDTEVWIGARCTNQLKCRLVAIKLPVEVANERIRKAKKASKKTLSAYEIELLRWNILITNASKEILSAEAACALYRLRWQIELLFKACKSYLNINKVGRCGATQLECIIYGRLIAAVIVFGFYAVLNAYYYIRCSRYVSMLSFFSIISTKAVILLEIIFHRKGDLISTLERVARQSFYEKRRRKTSMEAFLQYCNDSFYQKTP
jgi:hypothetical protein